MKRLENRQDIGMAINFGRYPVLSIDLADADEYGLKGCRVRIDNGKFPSGEPYIIGATLRVYRDDRKLVTHGDCCCISDSFTYSDFTDIVERAMAPMIRKDQDVVIAIYDSRIHIAYAPMLVKTSSWISPHSISPIGFEEVDMTNFLIMAGVELRVESTEEEAE